MNLICFDLNRNDLRKLLSLFANQTVIEMTNNMFTVNENTTFYNNEK